MTTTLSYYFLGVRSSARGGDATEQLVEVTLPCFNLLESSGFSALCNNLQGRNMVVIESRVPLPTGRLVCVAGFTDTRRLKYNAVVDVELEEKLQALSPIEITALALPMIRNHPWRLIKVHELHVALGLEADFTVDNLHGYLSGRDPVPNSHVRRALLNLLRRRMLYM